MSKQTTRRFSPRGGSLVRAHSSQLFQVEKDCLMDCCVSVNTVRALTVWILAKHDAWDEYLKLSDCDPESDSFPDDYLVTVMLSKNPLLRTAADPLGKAKTKWYEAEELCKTTNVLFGALEIGSALPVSPIFDAYLAKMRVEVARILGPLRPIDLERVESGMRFGPGTTSSVKGDLVLPSRKYVANFDATPRLAPFVRSFIPHDLGYMEEVPLVLGNKAAFVPKNAKTHRAIAVEPHANIFYQLGVGGLLRDRLRRTGIDLEFQADVNRTRVLTDRDIATIDLSSASDTISKALVAHVLPIDWYHLLDIGRCDSTAIDGKWHCLEKFSSMGNGYTFELETLLFLAACRATGAINIDVFGDDIIVEQSSAHKVLDFLKFLGFVPNEKKTFLAGTFFESCGVDVWRGSNVRPFYLKGSYESLTIARIRVANAIRIYAHRRMLGYGCDRRFFKPWIRSHERDPMASRTRSPVNASNNGIIRNLDEANSHPPRHRCWDGWIASQIAIRPPDSPRTSQLGALRSWLHSPGTPMDYTIRSHKINAQAPSRGIEPVRSAQGTLRLSTYFVSEWVELGPWI